VLFESADKRRRENYDVDQNPLCNSFISESITDPLLNAWFTSGGFEIGDLCAYDYGTNASDSGNANQAWNGNFYELQTEFDYHALTRLQP
jgi:hypothetical protein